MIVDGFKKFLEDVVHTNSDFREARHYERLELTKVARRIRITGWPDGIRRKRVAFLKRNGEIVRLDK